MARQTKKAGGVAGAFYASVDTSVTGIPVEAFGKGKTEHS
jgi:hypothetical protein